ncbi:hypothetical protein QYF61_011773 [Mycteria americana]|uniref:Uncharacterized protein n=1 Tax=Mycteria americana TaxID=33587 RepID=A0AAN7NCL7_MYCAM|nr:hypothetical protein QYF61_011773 [Mycteria americana]
MTISNISRNPMASKSCVTGEWDCWYNFTLVGPTVVTCGWQQHRTGPGLSKQRCTGLSFRFKIDMIEPDPATPPDLTSPTAFDTPQDGVTLGTMHCHALEANQWLLLDILPQWGEVNEKDHQLIVNALGVTQNIWEGEEGTLPTEIRKVIWDNATEFEKEFQSWWYPVNFTYDPTDGKATAFVLTIRNASVYAIYPIIALGLNPNGAMRYPLEHRVRAQQNGNKWQTLDVNARVVQEQQGFICESNALKAQDICLDTEQNVVVLKYNQLKPLKLDLYILGKDVLA